MCYFLKRGRKLMKAGEMKEQRQAMFKELLMMSEMYKHIN